MMGCVVALVCAQVRRLILIKDLDQGAVNKVKEPLHYSLC